MHNTSVHVFRRYAGAGAAEEQFVHNVGEIVLDIAILVVTGE